MKALFLVLVSIMVVSCGKSGSDYGTTDAAPTGTIAKQWVSMGQNGGLIADSIDLSNPLSVTFTNLKWSERYMENGIWKSHDYRGNCTVATDGGLPDPHPSLQFYTVFTVSSVTSGDPVVCSKVAQLFTVKHYRPSNRDFDMLAFAAAILK